METKLNDVLWAIDSRISELQRLRENVVNLMATHHSESVRPSVPLTFPSAAPQTVALDGVRVDEAVSRAAATIPLAPTPSPEPSTVSKEPPEPEVPTRAYCDQIMALWDSQPDVAMSIDRVIMLLPHLKANRIRRTIHSMAYHGKLDSVADSYPRAYYPAKEPKPDKSKASETQKTPDGQPTLRSLEEQLERACKERDKQRSNGYEGLAKVEQRRIDRLEEQIEKARAGTK